MIAANSPIYIPPVDQHLVFEESGHRYFHRGVELPSVSRTIAPLVDLSGIPFEVLEAKRVLGSYVHKACELFDEGTLDFAKLDARLVGYVNAWKQFRADTQFEPAIVERPFAAATMGFAGTPDRVGMMAVTRGTQPLRWLLDLKSCVTLWPWTKVQLAGYRMLLEANGVEVDALGALQLMPDGEYKLHRFVSPDDPRAFAACITLMNWRSKNAR